jgi:tetratricopeptide (TPR) repeat protein
MLLPLRGLGAPCTQHRPAATPCRTLNTSGENCRRSSCRAARLDWPDGQSVISSVAESIKPAVTEEQVAIKRAAKAARLSGQLQQALQILQDGLQLYPQDLHLLALAASTSSKLGHHHQAQQYLDTALQLDSSNVRLLCTQAGAAGRRQQYDTARHLYQRAHDANRYNPVVLHSWATMEAAAGDWGAARELAEAAIAADSRYLQAYVLRARLDAACGDAAAARAWHQQAMQVHPAYAPNLHVGILAATERQQREGQGLGGLCSREPKLSSPGQNTGGGGQGAASRAGRASAVEQFILQLLCL